MAIRFGVSPIAWINDDMPELGGDTPLSKVLADARDIGFEGIELGGVFPRDPMKLKPLLDSYRLTLVGGWCSGNLLVRTAKEEIAAIQPHLALLKAMGSNVFVYAETSNAIHGDKSKPVATTPRLDKASWIRFGEHMSTLADYIRDQGMRFAYHHHLGTVVERPEDMRAFIENTRPSVGLTLDTGHAALGGLNPVETIRQYPERIAHVHCKDVRGKVYERLIDGDGSFLEGVLAGMFTVPGDGDLDYAAVMSALADINYSGWIVVEAEQDPAKADPRKYGELGLRTLRLRASEAGLKLAA